ncbi:PrsW family glutamic-type intramembrane protease [Nostoc sp. LPT]|uniref:PrsW family intramembrane metalloprotease n=1 Tax=Nostoc sp. LPT TaxID=2815387 RepID=UPI001D6DFCDC|nr:PrsW family glutamic-type intramembrane protease [Nostoc sp. LPT]MBN4000666.1 PrsW family intramembrane metalloprotease [Nostoc sp. LPT]
MTNLIDPVVKDYLLHNSRWRSPVGKAILLMIVLIVSVLAYLGIYADKNPFVIWLWVPYSIAGSIVGYFLISFLDRERRVRFFHFLTIASVFFITAPAAAFFNNISPYPRATVGFVEEGLKILPVLLLAIYIPNLIRTRKDGIVYGALAGMGFNIIEMGLYIANLIHDSPMLDTLVQQSTRFGLWGLSAHIIWSGFVGMGIGFAAESTQRGWSKWKRFVLFYLIAAIMHSAYDSGLLAFGIIVIASIVSFLKGIPIDSDRVGKHFGPLWDGMRYGSYIYNIVLIIILLVQIKRSFRLENRLQAAELSTEESTVVPEEELKKIRSERLFFKRKYKNFPKAIGSKIVLYQNLLAMQKHTATQLGLRIDKVEPVVVLRKAIQLLRTNHLQGRVESVVD